MFSLFIVTCFNLAGKKVLTMLALPFDPYSNTKYLFHLLASVAWVPGHSQLLLTVEHQHSPFQYQETAKIKSRTGISTIIGHLL